MFIAGADFQPVPSYSSTEVNAVSPPIAKLAVCVPAAPGLSLATYKGAALDHASRATTVLKVSLPVLYQI